MDEYPWEKSLSEIVDFEKRENGACIDLPELSVNEIERLITKTISDETWVRLHLLSHAIDQEKLTPKQAKIVMSHLQSVHIHLNTCFAAIALSQSIETKSLLWLLKEVIDSDVIDHAYGNLA